ncbi:MAG: potassium/proton antiporter [Bdellovibrionia bacterium]
MTAELIISVGATLLLLSVITSKLLGRFGVPSLLVFLAIGMLAGSEGIGGIYFDNALAAQTLGSIALVFILFSGGLDTDIQKIKPVLKEGILLSTVGVVITTTAIGGFAVFLLEWSWLEGLLLGSIMSSTDAAAVFSALRSRTNRLKKNVSALLELESGSNDPMAVVLTILLIQLLGGKEINGLDAILDIVLQFLLGGAFGFFWAKAYSRLFNKLHLEYEGLYPVLSISLMLMLFFISQKLGANGYLAVYICGIFLSDKQFVSKSSTVFFHDGMAWVMQIAMFLALGLLVFPTRLVPVAASGLLLATFLIFVARPIGVYISMWGSKFSNKEKLLVSWVGLRGSVPIILATFPFVASIEKADAIFNIVFFVVFASVLFQGTTIKPVAKFLGLLEKKTTPRRPPEVDFEQETLSLQISPNSPLVGKNLVEVQLPEGVLVVLIQRGTQKIIPRGSTLVEAHDVLLVMADKTFHQELIAKFT